MDSLYSQFMNSDSLYYGFRAKDKFFDKNANKECEKFINRFFRVGQKELALMFAFRKEYLTNGKHVHTVSVYLLGELIHKHHKDYVNDYIDEKLEYDFSKQANLRNSLISSEICEIQKLVNIKFITPTYYR